MSDCKTLSKVYSKADNQKTKVLALVAQGFTLIEISRMEEYEPPPRRTMYYWLHNDPVFAEAYQRARNTSVAERCSDDLMELQNLVGVLAHSGALSDNYLRAFEFKAKILKWHAEGLAPERFGAAAQKKQLDVVKDTELNISVEVVGNEKPGNNTTGGKLT